MTGDASRRIADALRTAIEAGEFAPGQALPATKDLMERFGVARDTVYKALRLLAAEGHVHVAHRQRATVRERPRSRIIVRDRTVYRDEIGYFFDHNAKDWAAIGTPTRGLTVPPDHVADLLSVPRGQDVLTRDRHMGPRGSEQILQVATSYLPLALVAEIPALGAEKTGPGGIYDRLEEHFGSPLEWDETVWSRLPDETEQAVLKTAKTIPLLVVTRTARVMRAGELIAAEVNETRMPSERFALAYRVQRDSSAEFPRAASQPAE